MFSVCTVFHNMLGLRILWSFVYSCLRGLIKWYLRQTTRLCELQRICYGNHPGAHRTLGVEHSLNASKALPIKKLIVRLDNVSANMELVGDNELYQVSHAVQTVINVKKINPKVHSCFISSFSKCVRHIWGYKQLLVEIEVLRTTWYDFENEEHEEKLLQLWDMLMPGVELEDRVSKQWQDIGFQGDDPKTDFRGMGLLGLENLLYFATEYQDTAGHVLTHSHHPKYGYGFAIVGINLTSMAYRLFKDGSAKTHVFNSVRSSPTIHIFHQFYCYLFYEFDRYWIKCKPKNVMDYSRIAQQFEENIRCSLKSPSTVFRINICVDNV